MTLGPRQQEILWLVGKGETNKQIARALSVSDHTVKNTLTAIYRKLVVRNRAGAAVKALTEGLFDEEIMRRCAAIGPSF